MEMNITDQRPTFDNYKDNGYYDSLVDDYIKEGGAHILGWWLAEESFYFSCPIKNDPKFNGATPLILIDRTKQWCMYDDEFHGEWYEDLYDKCVAKCPYTILTLGCDDGKRGWLFQSKKEALNWFREFSEIIKTFPNDFESGWEVHHYFQDNMFEMN